MSVIDVIANRTSPFAFAETPVEEEKLEAMFRAASLAPSSNNEQPWRFIVATQSDGLLFRKLADCMRSYNRIWAERAPVLVLTVSKRYFGDDPTRPNRYSLYDAGAAMAQFTLQGMALGIYVHQVGGFSREQAARELNIPEAFEPVVMAAVGYPGNVQTLPEEVKAQALQKPSRQSLSQLVFRGAWKL